MWEAITEWKFIEETLGTVFTALGLWVGYLSVKRVGRRVVQEMAGQGEEHGARAATLWSLVRRIIIIAFLVTGGLMIISVWRLPLAPFLAVGSAAGVAIGLGASGLVQDVISGFSFWPKISTASETRSKAGRPAVRSSISVPG